MCLCDNGLRAVRLKGFAIKMKPKNFRLPVPLAKIWDKYFNPPGSKESSAHAAGACFLYWIMPDYVRMIAREAAKAPNVEQARDQFWQRYRELGQNREARTLLDDALADEEGLRERTAAKNAESP